MSYMPSMSSTSVPPPVGSQGMATSAYAPSSQPPKPQRVLACIRCQQRKVKCDRRFPCANCTKSRAQCVPATQLSRARRKRRFPERELLDRLHNYESLLRQNNIQFESLHDGLGGGKQDLDIQGGDDSDEEQGGADHSSPATTIKSERGYEAKNFWETLNLGFRDGENESDSSHEDVGVLSVKKGWVELFGGNDHLLFGSPNTNIDLSTLHPDPVQIFRLWQVYMDNVNPLLKVTHTPSLQGRIIEASSDITKLNPAFEALMFSIYCMATLSLMEDDCQSMFGSSQEDLLRRFNFGCQQALLKAGFLRSSDRECLTALYLYLISVRSNTVPQSLSAMLSVAIRTAQRMGIDSESNLARCSVFEAEMRRRLWWSLVLFDSRISEMAEHQTTTLAPTWDCYVPLNVGDSELQPEMKEPPPAQTKPTDALFAVVRSELGESIRHMAFYLDFTNPALKHLFKTSDRIPKTGAEELSLLEKMIEDKYLTYCDPGNPLHFTTIWWTRAYIARSRLLESISQHSATIPQTDAQRDTAITNALRMLECDTMFRTSPLSTRFLWLIDLHFPFPAYIQLVQELKRRPCSERAEEAWEAMSVNFQARFDLFSKDSESPFFKIFTNMVLRAWEVREAALGRLGVSFVLPGIVSSMRQRLAQIAYGSVASGSQVSGNVPGSNNFPISMPLAGSYGHMFNAGNGGLYDGMALAQLPSGFDQNASEFNMDHLQSAGMGWELGGIYSELWNTNI